MVDQGPIGAGPSLGELPHIALPSCGGQPLVLLGVRCFGLRRNRDLCQEALVFKMPETRRTVGRMTLEISRLAGVVYGTNWMLRLLSTQAGDHFGYLGVAHDERTAMQEDPREGVQVVSFGDAIASPSPQQACAVPGRHPRRRG